MIILPLTKRREFSKDLPLNSKMVIINNVVIIFLAVDAAAATVAAPYSSSSDAELTLGQKSSSREL